MTAVAGPATRELHGREAERAALGELLDGARAGRSGVLVLRGAPGLGKTALLDDAAARADGLRVLRAAGAEEEADVPFAGLHQLLHPVLERSGGLPPPQAHALRRALGVESGGPAPAPLLLGAAVLGLLAEAAPVLAVVDDAQWLDAPSRAALAFAARRLRAEGIAVAAAVGEEDASTSLPELVLAPLDADAATALLGDLAPAVRAALVEACAGNPLALVELPAALGPEQLAGRAELELPLPVPARLDAVYGARLAALPGSVRPPLLIAAAEGSGDAAPVLRAIDGAMEPLEASGFLALRGERLVWRHPLARSVVLRAAGAAELRAAYAALAAVADADRAAWYRAAAAVGPDAGAADALAAAGERARRRAGHATAAAALARAAELTPDPETRAARRVAAAGGALSAGSADRALALLDAAGTPAATGARAEAARIRGAVELQRGSPAAASRLLSEAARALVADDPAQALRLGVSAMEAASLAGLPPLHPLGADAAPDDATDLAADELAFLRVLVAGIEALFAGDTGTAAPRLGRVVEAGAAVEDPQLIVWAGAAAFFVGDEDAAVALHERAAARARASGDAAVLPFALTFLASAHLWSGRPAAAEADAEEAARLAREAGQDNLALQADGVLAGIAALRGRETQCRALAERARATARERGLVLVEGAATIALAELELALGAPDAAFDRLDRLAHAPGAHQAHRFAVVPTLVEAAARAARPEDARTAATGFSEWAHATGSGWALPLAARSLALVAADPAEADALLAEALALHDRHRRPLDRARTELLIGERLRRARHKAEARAPLRAALETFDAAGAEPWAERARDELRAAGAPAPRAGGRPLDRLTPQELQVARLVARGASNSDAAAALYLSPRTVEYHLHKVFRKLGLHARAELAAALAGSETG